MMRQAGLWWIAAVLMLAASAVYLDASGSGLFPGDREGLVLAAAMRSPWLDKAFSLLTWFGSLILLLPLATATGMVLWLRGRRAEAYFLVGALVGAAMLTRLAKFLVQRPRPELFQALVAVDSPLSFPSTHAFQAGACALAMLLILYRLRPRTWPWAAAVLGSAVLLVDVSRLYLQVHYPSDVLAGTVAAVCWVFGLRALVFDRTAVQS